jgi:hypothetical protein
LKKNPRKKRTPTRIVYNEESSDSSQEDIDYNFSPQIDSKEVKPDLIKVTIVKKDEWSPNHLLCTRCKGKGHTTTRCTVDLTKICGICNAYGHLAHRCEISCGICQKFGHKTNQHGKYCNNCKKFNHNDNECRNK